MIKIRWRKVLLGLLLCLLVWYGFLLTRIYAYSSQSDAAPADAAIVLGAAVWGTRPSPVFAERINHAIALYQAGEVGALVFTGGVGQNDERAEAEVARDYAVQRGVPVEHIYVETRSRTTYENLLGAKAVLVEQGGGRVLIVSDPLHMKRAVTIARDLGLDAYPSPTPTSRYETWKSKSGFLLREGYFYASYLLRRPFRPELHSKSNRSEQFQKLIYRHSRLATDGSEGAGIQIAGVHRDCDQQVASFELKVAAALADFVETGLFQGRNHLSGFEGRQFRHRRGR
jgi:uncharacterized SAM-binding protein YcdF (DUF218 family)